MRPSRAVIAAVAVAATSVACADLFGFHDLREGELDASDGASDATNDVNDAGDAAIDTYVCNPTSWPGNPSQENSGDAGDRIVAIQHLYLETTPDGGLSRAGYDLDGKCTVDTNTASCTGPNGVTDQANGIDDESIALMNTLKGTPIGGNLSDDKVNASIAAGTFTEIVRLLGYNGGSDQPLLDPVLVAIQASPGIDTPATPNFDGNDSWRVSSADTVSSFNTYPSARYNGYVNKNVLVAKFPQPITLHVILSGIVTGPLAITLQQATLTATIVRRDGGTDVDLTNGLIVGRWASRDILNSVASLTISGEALCDYYDASVLPGVKAIVCVDTDIRAAGPDDNSQPCDAISVAIGFDGVAAQLGAITQYPTSATPCSRDAGDCP